MVLTDNLVSWFSLNGDANDSLGNYNGTENGSPVYASGLIGSALSADGTDDYIQATNLVNSLTDDFAVSIWVNIADVDKSAFARIWQMGDGGNDGGSNDSRAVLNLDGSSGNAVGALIEMGGSAASVNGTTDITNSSWHHLVLNWDNTGKTYDVYVDNSLELNDQTGAGDPDSIADQDFLIAAGDTLNTKGLFCLCGVWSRQLTTDEISELYNGGSGVDYPFTTSTRNSLFLGGGL